MVQDHAHASALEDTKLYGRVLQVVVCLARAPRLENWIRRRAVAVCYEPYALCRTTAFALRARHICLDIPKLNAYIHRFTLPSVGFAKRSEKNSQPRPRSKLLQPMSTLSRAEAIRVKHQLFFLAYRLNFRPWTTLGLQSPPRSPC